jgi:hypothetical protein
VPPCFFIAVWLDKGGHEKVPDAKRKLSEALHRQLKYELHGIALSAWSGRPNIQPKKKVGTGVNYTYK